MQDLQKAWKIIDCDRFKNSPKICHPASVSIKTLRNGLNILNFTVQQHKSRDQRIVYSGLLNEPAFFYLAAALRH